MAKECGFCNSPMTTDDGVDYFCAAGCVPCVACGKAPAQPEDDECAACQKEGEEESEPDYGGPVRDEWKHQAAEWQRLK